MIYDLTHPITDGMPVYPGDPAVQIRQVLTIEADGCADRQLTMGTHNGTHMDAPAHMIDGGKQLKDFAAADFVRSAVCIDARSGFDAAAVAAAITNPGMAVLFYTGASERFTAESYWSDYLVLDDETIRVLIENGVGMVGVDTGSFDNADGFPVHKSLLSADILLIENLAGLESLIGKTFELIALPLKLEADGAPARVIAKLA